MNNYYFVKVMVRKGQEGVVFWNQKDGLCLNKGFYLD